jgi:hypothetical protein
MILCLSGRVKADNDQTDRELTKQTRMNGSSFFTNQHYDLRYKNDMVIVIITTIIAKSRHSIHVLFYLYTHIPFLSLAV